jgi:hypothetical protein
MANIIRVRVGVDEDVEKIEKLLTCIHSSIDSRFSTIIALEDQHRHFISVVTVYIQCCRLSG